MIFRIINALVMAIAIFYVLELTGIIEKRKYFPTLPRLEASASDPSAWIGAATWGFSQLSNASRGGESFDTGSIPSTQAAAGGGSLMDSLQSFTGNLRNLRSSGGGSSYASSSGSGSSSAGSGGGYRMNYLSGY